jgi:hypothetical protein
MVADVPLVNFRDIENELDKLVSDQTFDDLDDGISNLTVFLTELIRLIEEIKITLKDEDIYKDFWADYRLKTIGCQEFCILCRR